jgi:hypothetical protein
MTKYMHKETGSVDTRENWECSYASEELEERGLTASEAFDEDKGKTLIALDDTHERVIFDNAGGITLQLHGYAHYYQDPAEAAHDVAEWIKDHDTIGWEGHEDESLALDPASGEIRNGGYWIWPVGDDKPNSDALSGHSERDFFDALDKTGTHFMAEFKDYDVWEVLGEDGGDGSWADAQRLCDKNNEQYPSVKTRIVNTDTGKEYY